MPKDTLPNAERYIVGWPGRGVIKVGTTHVGRSRWGKFLCRGGEMLDQAFYENPVECAADEVWLQDKLSESYEEAFQKKADAIDFIGGDGSGWRECFAVPESHWGAIVQIARKRGEVGI